MGTKRTKNNLGIIYMDNSLLQLIQEHTGYSLEIMQEHMKMYFEEKKDLRRRKFRKILEQQYHLGTLGDLEKGMLKMEQINVQKAKLLTAKAHNNLFLFITVNPKPDIPFDEFRKKMDKLANRNIFNSALYVFEQRGITEENAGKGFHCHMLTERNLNYKPTKVVSCVQNTCKSLCNVKDKRVLNIQLIGEEFAEDKRIYILGQNKTGEGKSVKQTIDQYWRKKNNLNSTYKDANQADAVKIQETQAQNRIVQKTN